MLEMRGNLFLGRGGGGDQNVWTNQYPYLKMEERQKGMTFCIKLLSSNFEIETMARHGSDKIE